MKHHELLLLLSLAVACGGESSGGASQGDAGPEAQPETSCIGTLWIPGEFDYRMRGQARVAVTLVYPDGSPRTGVVVRVFRDASDPADRVLLAAGITGSDGRFQCMVPVLPGETSVEVIASFVGVNNVGTATILDGTAHIELGRE